ncbi:MAG TPA: NAD-dependent epimerase/dehydratase family protein, partial [Salinibacter sp.]|nr:NAD-dependent epimerase/dehydratase family protein [Salinibacter sp.]
MVTSSDRPVDPGRSTDARRPTVAIAGATGFVGTAVREALRPDYDLIGLTRSPVRARFNTEANTGETWRHCDLFDPYAVEEGL